MSIYAIEYLDDGAYHTGPFATLDDAERALLRLPADLYGHVVEVEPFADVLADYGRPGDPVWSGR